MKHAAGVEVAPGDGDEVAGRKAVGGSRRRAAGGGEDRGARWSASAADGGGEGVRGTVAGEDPGSACRFGGGLTLPKVAGLVMVGLDLAGLSWAM